MSHQEHLFFLVRIAKASKVGRFMIIGGKQPL